MNLFTTCHLESTRHLCLKAGCYSILDQRNALERTKLKKSLNQQVKSLQRRSQRRNDLPQAAHPVLQIKHTTLVVLEKLSPSEHFIVLVI
jgi:hypothetical protein